MGLFTQGPEQNEEWAGLPSEPARRESEAERLPDAAPAADALGLDLLGGGGSVESILIPVAPVVEVSQPSESNADGDADVEETLP